MADDLMPRLRKPGRCLQCDRLGGLALFVPAAGGLPDRPAPSHRGSTEGMTGVCVATTGMEDQHRAVAIGAVPGSGRRGEPRRHAERVPGAPVRDWIRRSRSCTCRGLAMDLSYTCAGDVPDHEAAMPACGRCEPGARSADVDLAMESGAFHSVAPRYRPDQDRGVDSVI